MTLRILFTLAILVGLAVAQRADSGPSAAAALGGDVPVGTGQP